MLTVDHARVFDAMPTPCAVLDPTLVIVDCNAAYRAVTGRSAESLIGRGLFEAFPETDPHRQSAIAVRRTLQDALATGKTMVLGVQRYDISTTGGTADVQERYWSTTVVPLHASCGNGESAEVVGLLYAVHDVTALTTARAATGRPGQPRVRELFQAAVELTEQARLFDEVAVAERQLGLAVQDAMLPAQVPAELRDRVAVRYRPAWDVLHVGGDWYDVTHLDDDRFAVAVGDVVGHGLGAAVLMGQLRAALNALTQADLGPAEALTGLDRFARQDDAAVATTVVKLVLDLEDHTVTYSSAGHPPAILFEADGSARFLDQAQGAALALPGTPEPRPTATTAFAPGARLVLFTDGLIERRDVDLGTSLTQLADLIATNRHLRLEELADILLEQRASDQRDDIALLLVQL